MKSYLDANVLLSFSAGVKRSPKQYKNATIIMNEIKSGKTIGVISSLTLLEVLAVLRTIQSKQTHILKNMDDNEQLSFVLDQSRILYDKLVNELLKLPNIEFVKGVDVNLAVAMDQAFDTLQKIKGKMKYIPNCKRCGHEEYHYTYKALGSADMLHSLMAKYTNCDDLITFDRDYENLVGLEIFENLKFRIML